MLYAHKLTKQEQCETAHKFHRLQTFLPAQMPTPCAYNSQNLLKGWEHEW